jgi:hypothetical protein
VGRENLAASAVNELNADSGLHGRRVRRHSSASSLLHASPKAD